MPDTTPRTLLLIGHGASGHLDSSAPLYACAQALRASKLFTRVVPLFWKESPSYWTGLLALAAVDLGDVFVVPFFMADGYFTRVVMRDFFGSDSPLRQACTSTSWTFAPPIGVDASILDVALDALRQWSDVRHRQREAVLILVGHGTRRHARSGGSTEALATKLRERVIFHEVYTSFLDQSPTFEEVVASVSSSYEIVVLPVLTADGFHTRSQLPELAGLSFGGGPTPALPVEGVDASLHRRVYVASALGTSPVVTESVLGWVRTQLDTEIEEAPRFEEEQEWASWVCTQGRLGELCIRVEGDHVTLCHWDDRARSVDDLLSVQATSYALRMHTRLTSGGDVRPVPEHRGLRRGWVCLHWPRERVLEAIEAVYPSWFWSQLSKAQTPRDTQRSWEEIRALFRGSRLTLASDEVFRETVHETCAKCILRPVWMGYTAADGARCASPCPMCVDLLAHAAKR